MANPLKNVLYFFNMSIVVSKKTVYIGLIILVVSAVVFFIAFFFFSNGNNSQLAETQNQLSITPFPTTKVESNLIYKDPLGYSFSYPESLKIDNHPEDNINYSNVEVFTKDQTGRVKILVSDVGFSDINSWVKSNADLKSANLLDSKLGSLDAKKAYVDATKKIVIATIWDGMLLKMEVMPSDNNEAVSLSDKILAGMQVPETASYTDSNNTNTNNPNNDTNSGVGSDVSAAGDEEVIE